MLSLRNIISDYCVLCSGHSLTVGMDLNSPSEPTQILSLMGQYHSQLRHSTSTSRMSLGNASASGG